MGKDIKESTKGRTIASKGSNTDEKVQNERKRANVDSSNQSVIKKKVCPFKIINMYGFAGLSPIH